ncbi:DUF4333 domain-containing protein [Nocardiopsis potens]|uniref:DUF4333 domain-containing protein n=1 Tax=Nocardiopsis potens TaxID=1246458 RepID=UPI000348D57A|nr:DUF4333 domain-containing protein [Nocardiopsis potens]
MGTQSRSRVAAGVGLGALAVLLTAGCSFSIGDVEPVESGDTGPAEGGGAGENGAPEESGGAPEEGGGASDAGGGAGAVPADEVAQQAATVLEEQVGQAPDDLTCPEDLPAEVGASIRCELTAGGDTLGVTVTATSVDGGDVGFDVKVDEQPAG